MCIRHSFENKFPGFIHLYGFYLNSKNIKKQLSTFYQFKGVAMQILDVLTLFIVSIVNSIKWLAIHHMGVKSKLETQNQWHVALYPLLLFGKRKGVPLFKHSMPFFNSHLNFHLRRQAKTNWSSQRSTLGISALPTLIIISEEPFSHSPLPSE